MIVRNISLVPLIVLYDFESIGGQTQNSSGLNVSIVKKTLA